MPGSTCCLLGDPRAPHTALGLPPRYTTPCPPKSVLATRFSAPESSVHAGNMVPRTLVALMVRLAYFSTASASPASLAFSSSAVASALPRDASCFQRL